MFITKNDGVVLEIDPKKLDRYKEKGYKEVEEKKPAKKTPKEGE